ncbi:UNVERIFIED_CONTAM: hypothetical protein O8I53_05245 [Campylobacter lari]
MPLITLSAKVETNTEINEIKEYILKNNLTDNTDIKIKELKFADNKNRNLFIIRNNNNSGLFIYDSLSKKLIEKVPSFDNEIDFNKNILIQIYTLLHNDE